MSGLHGFGKRRGAGGQPNGSHSVKPVSSKFVRTLDVKRGFAGSATGFDQLSRIVARPSAYHHDRIRCLNQFSQR